MSHSNAISATLPIPPSYGFVEVKKWIGQHTWIALIITLTAVALLTLASNYLDNSIPLGTVRRGLPPIEVDPFAPAAIAPATAVIIPERIDPKLIGNDFAAGRPVAVPNAELKNVEFAPWELSATTASHTGEYDPESLSASEIERAMAPQKIEVSNIVAERDNESAFHAVEVEPAFDMNDLLGKLDYPPVARANGIEGTVVIRVRIDENGTPAKMYVYSSSSRMLSDAALKAVAATVFTPALQNDVATYCWINIPITFKLK